MFLKKEILVKAGLAFIAILLSFLGAEIFLRSAFPLSEKRYVWPPNLQYVFYPDSNIIYGIKEKSTFTINSEGFRGKEFENNQTKKYLCLGGSTTECLYLDDTETWPALLAKKTGCQIGNIGKSACTSRENYLQLKYVVPQMGKIDGIIIMVGFNDLMKRLSRDTLFESDFHFTPEIETELVNTILFSNQSGKHWWQKSRLLRLIKPFIKKVTGHTPPNLQDNTGAVYNIWRTKRKSAVLLLDTLPDLHNALNEFERNLTLIYKQTQEQKIKLWLVNQAALYSDTTNAYENSLLWMGGVGNFQQNENSAYYTANALRNGLEQYNARLEKFCTENDIVYIDINNQLARDTSVFYDDCHFNENGARQVAGIIAKKINH